MAVGDAVFFSREVVLCPSAPEVLECDTLAERAVVRVPSLFSSSRAPTAWVDFRKTDRVWFWLSARSWSLFGLRGSGRSGRGRSRDGLRTNALTFHLILEVVLITSAAAVVELTTPLHGGIVEPFFPVVGTFACVGRQRAFVRLVRARTK